MLRKILIAGVCVLSLPQVHGERIEGTLRIDFGIYGEGDKVEIKDMRFKTMPEWHGKKGKMDEVVWDGNAQVEITDRNGKTMYLNSFSTLFNEWYSGPRNNGRPAEFENTILVPMPTDSVGITLRFNDVRHNLITKETFSYIPGVTAVESVDVTPKYPVRIIRYGGEDAINVGILAEGYREEEMVKFYAAAQRGIDELMNYSPFCDYPEAFNFIAVGTPSAESGVTKKSKGLEVSTPFGAHFDTFDIERYLTIPHVYRLHDALASIPYEHIIVLGNTDEYGGSGIYNHYMMMAADSDRFLPAFVHEFGHSFGGLADEYFQEEVEEGMYPTDIEPWEPNITTLVDFDSKWKSMLSDETPVPTQPTSALLYPVGVYEGAGYASKRVYRPANECRMRNNTYPTYCPVCTEALRKVLEF